MVSLYLCEVDLLSAEHLVPGRLHPPGLGLSTETAGFHRGTAHVDMLFDPTRFLCQHQLL